MRGLDNRNRLRLSNSFSFRSTLLSQYSIFDFDCLSLQYESGLVAFLSNELFNCCEYEVLSEEGLLEIFESHEHPIANWTVALNSSLRRDTTQQATEGVIRLPDSIENCSSPMHLDSHHIYVKKFIHLQSGYNSVAKDYSLMTMPDADEHGQLFLHHAAVRDKVRLGSIKLLVKCHPSAIQHADTNSVLPIHLACLHHKNTRVIE